VRAVEAAKRYGPADPHLMDTLGWIYVKQGRPEKAIRLLRLVAAQEGGRFPALHYHLAEAYLLLDRPKDAERELKAALQMRGPFTQRKAAEDRLKQIQSESG